MGELLDDVACVAVGVKLAVDACDVDGDSVWLTETLWLLVDVAEEVTAWLPEAVREGVITCDGEADCETDAVSVTLRVWLGLGLGVDENVRACEDVALGVDRAEVVCE